MCRSRLVLAFDVGAVGNTVVVVVGVPIVDDQLKPNRVAGTTATGPRVSFDPITVRGLGPDGSLSVPGLAVMEGQKCSQVSMRLFARVVAGPSRTTL